MVSQALVRDIAGLLMGPRPR